MATNTSPTADNGTRPLQPQSTVGNENQALTADIEAVSNVQVRLPPFWPKNPAVWFTQVEALFDLRRITSQRVKYLHVVSTLPSEVADEFDDVLSVPHPSEPYEQFKAIVLKRKMVSEHSRLQQLLNAEELGDRRPSEMLHRIRQLIGDGTQDSTSPLLRELFLQRLPQNVVPVLAAAGEMPLEKLAELADRIYDYSPAGPAVASATAMTPDTEARHSRLEEKVDELAASIAAMRTSTPRPFRGSSRSRSRSRSTNNRDGYCWYHARFGASAMKCRKPCRWQENTNASR